MTPITSRPIPDGFQLDWDKETWNVGHAFMWSELYQQYIRTEKTITVKPGQTLPEAFEAAYGFSPGTDYEVFFVEENA